MSKGTVSVMPAGSPRTSLRTGSLLAAALVCGYGAGTGWAAGPGKVDFARRSGRSWPRTASSVTGPTRGAARGTCGSTPARTCSPTAAAIAVVVPGQPEESELIARITSDDPDEVMPPPESRRSLTKAQVELLKRWVAEGAAWSEHWSFVAAPAAGDSRGVGPRVVPQPDRSLRAREARPRPG